MPSLDTVGAFCLSESDAGSDAFKLRCRATKVDGGWSLTGVKAVLIDLIDSGTKQWISNAEEAGLFIVFATEDPSLVREKTVSSCLLRGTRGSQRS